MKNLKIKTVKMIEVSDWDNLVSETYGRPYRFQQQDGCQSRGQFHLTIPSKYTYDDEMNDEIPEEINSDRYFVDSFDFNVSTMPDFYLIEDRWERERIQRDFNNISEPWYFIQTKLSEEAKWLKLLHSKIKKKIQSKSVLT
jgi:hypothetical protein